jgi:hypothetical protein
MPGPLSPGGCLRSAGLGGMGADGVTRTDLAAPAWSPPPLAASTMAAARMAATSSPTSASVIGRTVTRTGVASVWSASPLRPVIVAPSVGVAMEPAPGRLRGACAAVARRLHAAASAALPDS